MKKKGLDESWENVMFLYLVQHAEAKKEEENPLDFKMGGIVCLKRFKNGRWSVEWMITPEVIP